MIQEQIHSVSSSFFRGWVGFLRNYRRGDQDFLVKKGEGIVHIGGGCVYRRVIKPSAHYESPCFVTKSSIFFYLP